MFISSSYISSAARSVHYISVIIVHLTCTSHKTSTTMPMHRDTTYGILSQLHLATISKMTDEVMPFLKLLLDFGPVHICVTCRRPRPQRLLTEEIHRSTRVSYKHSHRDILLLQVAYMYVHVWST